MVISDWDMASSFVNHRGIDEEMFMEVRAECIVVSEKIEPHLSELGEITKRPKMVASLRKIVMWQPDAKEVLASKRKKMKKWMPARAENAK